MARHSPAFEDFRAAALRRPEPWRLVAGILLVGAVYWILGGAALLGASALFGVADLDGRSPASMFAILATFLGLGLGAALAARLLHGRSAASLFGRASRAPRDFALAAVVSALPYGAALALWTAWFDAVPGLDAATWLALLPAALACLLLQVGAEEMAFRGYLQQQLAALSASPLAWAVLPSVLFAAAHLDPEIHGANRWLLLAAIAVFGLVAADLTARTGSLGAAMGLHFVNNVAAVLLLSVDGPLTGLALFRTPYSAGDAVLPWVVAADVAALLAAWAAIRRLLGR